MADIYNMADTWNNAGATYTAIKMDVTDTASAAASLLLDLLVGGASQFRVTKNGSVASASISCAPISGHHFRLHAGLTARGSVYLSSASDIVGFAGPLIIGGNTADTTSPRIASDGAGMLAQRNGTQAQTSLVYGTHTDASNYRRAALAMTTAGVATLKPEGAGTGASGNVLHISGLPTSNPGPGILWNDAGTVKVGT